MKRLATATVLVVDDGETNRNIVSVVLKRHGINILEAENGQQAIDEATSQHVDLILMDMQMPVMDGYTATIKLRSLGLTLPIIALTGNAMQGEKQQCIDTGCDGFLPKPIKIDCLVELLGEHLGYSDKPLATANNTNEKLSKPVPSASQQDSDPRSPGSVQASQTAEQTGMQSNILPWSSTLQLDDPEFLRIVKKFVVDLPNKLSEMIQLLNTGRLDELRGKGHWLKGAAGTVGLGKITEPALQLELAAGQGDATESKRQLEAIIELATAIEIQPKPDDFVSA